MDGPRNPHDILHVLGEKALQNYLVNEIQEVYRLQGVNINDKHLEVIVRQMMRWVKIEEIGDTEFLPEEVVDRFKFLEENAHRGRGRAAGRPRANRCCSASPRRRCPPTRSSRPPPSRRPPASSPKPPSTARWTTSAASRRTSSWAGSSRPAPAWSTTARSSIAGEDVVEEEGLPETEGVLTDATQSFEDDTPLHFTGGGGFDEPAEEPSTDET